MLHKIEKSGSTLVEVIIAMMLFTMVAFPIITMVLGSHTGTLRSEDSLEATALAQEGIEAVRAIRDYDWDDVEVGIHGLTSTGGYWDLSAEIDEDLLDKYTRRIEITDISSYKKEIIVTVGWEVSEGFDKEIVMTSRLTNWEVLSWIETLQADFDEGTLVDLVTVNGDGGEMQLASLPDWSSPELLDSYDTSDEYDGLDLAVEGNYAYLCTRRDNQGSDPGFYILDITIPGNVTLAGYYNLNADCNAVFIDGDHAFLATGLNQDELLVLDISNKANPVEAGSYNSDESKDGTAIYVSGNVAYLGTENNWGWYDHEFYALDIGDLSNITKLDSYNIYNTVNDIFVSGNQAYIATARLFDELIILNVQNPASLGYTGHYNEWGYYVGYGVTKEDDTLYYVSSDGWWGSNDFYIIDVSNPYFPSKIGALDLGTNYELCVMDSMDYVYVASSTNGEELTIIDIATPSSPTEYGYYDAGGDAYGIACDDTYVYLATANDSMEFQVIQPSASGDRYEESGTFTSAAFDTGSDTASLYSISWTESGDGDIVFQLRTADTEANLPSATWVGPGGSGSAYYSVSGTSIDVDPLASGTRWVQYQATFTGDGTTSPILEDVTLEYVQ